jgi:protein-tyrosine phosphatase
MQEYFKIIIPLLLKKYTVEKKSILIHCQAGKQRSAILIAALLKILLDKDYISLIKIPPCVYGKEQFQHICNYMLLKRPQVFTYGLRINFEPTYTRFFGIDISN